MHLVDSELLQDLRNFLRFGFQLKESVDVCEVSFFQLLQKLFTQICIFNPQLLFGFFFDSHQNGSVFGVTVLHFESVDVFFDVCELFE